MMSDDFRESTDLFQCWQGFEPAVRIRNAGGLLYENDVHSRRRHQPTQRDPLPRDSRKSYDVVLLHQCGVDNDVR